MKFFDRLLDALKQHEVSYSLVGGYAVSLHGAPRGTVDIDCIIEHNEQQFLAVEQALNKIGLKSKLPVTAREVFHFKSEYITRRGLVAWSFVNPSNPLECVDIIITHDKVNHKTVQLGYGDRFISVIALDELIRMKRESNRKQDQEDIKLLEIIYARQSR